MRSTAEIIEHLKHSIEEVTAGRLTASRISDSAELFGDLGLDSLDFASVMLSCETWLEVRVQEDGTDWQSLDRVDRLAEFMARQK